MRDVDSLKIRPWAQNGDRIIPELDLPPLDRSTGWTVQYALPGGPKPTRRLVNQLLREITGMLHEINQTGILQWSPWTSYTHVSFVRQGDGLYISRHCSGPSLGGSVSPDAPDQDAWQRY